MELVCGEPVVRPVVWVAFSLQNGLVDPITRKIYRCAGYKVKTFSLQRGGRAAENTKKSMTFCVVATKPGRRGADAARVRQAGLGFCLLPAITYPYT